AGRPADAVDGPLDVLDLEEIPEPLFAALPADAALPVAPPRGLRTHAAAAVDGDGAGPDPAGEVDGVAGRSPDVGVEAEAGGVGDGGGLVDVVVGDDHTDRGEQLLLADL